MMNKYEYRKMFTSMAEWFIFFYKKPGKTEQAQVPDDVLILRTKACSVLPGFFITKINNFAMFVNIFLYSYLTNE